MSKLPALAAILLFSGSPALADQTGSPSASKSGTVRDPNRMVCEKVEVIGTRLGSKRVCMTAAQWAEQRRQDRLEIDKGQMQARLPDAN